MSMQSSFVSPTPPVVSATGASAGSAPGAVLDDEVAPSRAMEGYLIGLVIASLAISISGLAFVYGFHLNDPLSFSNLSPTIRALIVDSSMACGSYFGRKFLMYRRKHFYHWFWALFWLVVTVGGASFSWFSNDLAVSAQGTIVTQALLQKAGWGMLDAATVNKVIAFLPIAAILVYLVAPRRIKGRVQPQEERTPEEILEDGKRELATLHVDLERRRMLAQQRGEGIGATLAAARLGLFSGLGRDQAALQTERQMADQMRVFLARHNYLTTDQARKKGDREVRLLAEAEGLWDPLTNQPTARALGPTKAEHLAALRKEAIRRGWLSPDQIEEEREMIPPDIAARYEGIEARLMQAEQEEARLREAEETTEGEDEEEQTEVRTSSPSLTAIGRTGEVPWNGEGTLVVPRYLTAGEIEQVTRKVRRTINYAIHTGALPIAQATFADGKRRVAAVTLIKKGWLPPDTVISGKTGLKLQATSSAHTGNEPGKGMGNLAGTTLIMATAAHLASAEPPHQANALGQSEQEGRNRMSKLSTAEVAMLPLQDI